MSYILDALRKAEAERQRGAVPDLHAQIPPPGNAASGLVQPSRGGAGWMVAGGLLVGAAAAAWWFFGRQAESSSAATARLAQEPAAAMAPASTVAPAMATVAPSAPASAAFMSAAAPAASSVTAGVDQPPTPASVPTNGSAATQPRPQPPPGNASPREAPPSKTVARARPTTSAGGSSTGASSVTPGKATARADAGAKLAVVPPVQPTASAPARLPNLAELPGDLRQQVPAMSIGGSVYSPQASARMIVVNGQVFQEGNALTPELTLEQIRPKSAVFTIRGQRFEVPL